MKAIGLLSGALALAAVFGGEATAAGPRKITPNNNANSGAQPAVSPPQAQPPAVRPIRTPPPRPAAVQPAPAPKPAPPSPRHPGYGNGAGNWDGHMPLRLGVEGRPIDRTPRPQPQPQPEVSRDDSRRSRHRHDDGPGDYDGNYYPNYGPNYGPYYNGYAATQLYSPSGSRYGPWYAVSYSYGNPYGYGNGYYGNGYYGNGYYGGYPNGDPYGYSGASYPYNSAPYAYQYPAYPGYGSAWYPPYPPALFMPAEQLYGPGPVMRMMGVDQWFNRPAVPAAPRAAPNGFGGGPAVGRAAAGDLAEVAKEDPKRAVQQANAKVRRTESAWKFISFGDAHFANRKYSDALGRYRKATESGADVADGWFRQGFAMMAMGNFDRAAKAVRHGLELNPDWASSNFHLDDLYGDDGLSKADHRKALIKAVEDDPTNSSAALMLGLHYYFDGKREMATPFLRRASEMLGRDAGLKAFIEVKDGG